VAQRDVRVMKHEEVRLVWTPSSEVPRSRGLCGHVAEYKVGPRISRTRGLGGGKFDSSTRRGREVARSRDFKVEKR
jgi:hypothetical protein